MLETFAALNIDFQKVVEKITRAISLQSIFWIEYEYNRILDQAVANGALSIMLFGFKKNRSTVDAINDYNDYML